MNELKLRIDKHKEMTDGIHEMFIKKNKDYGNSFEDGLDEFGFVTGVARLNEKMTRVKQLYNKNTCEVKDEPITDTLLDMANYAIMMVMWLEKHKEKS